ncbi:CamS family sex pheromone protein [Virgibacillus litoralis]|uniref:Protein involved in sex pheromone biosynthesis n=1 Tax=Virgibacillus litoralis TaxID=578221 RepID=A0ABS4HBD5_9BACI|nr:CamS family sex pheromone protein [Virgibacillus litoralis]MBP1948219.1 protein involved in sex pheromone biosynthesis [Virgibacillus litoralis]
MKKFIVWLLGTLLVLTSCSPSINDDEVVKQEDESEENTSIVSSNQFSKEEYRTILPYRPSASRGVIVNQMGNRLDIDEMEQGLRRLSKEYYDPEKYFFEEGQYLEEDMMYNWLEREMTEQQLAVTIANYKESFPNAPKSKIEEIRHENTLALNPPIKYDKSNKDDESASQQSWPSKKQQEENPKYLTHILEQNFLKKNEDNSVELVGMSIGIAMKSEYTFQTEDGGPSYHHEIPKSTMLKKGKEIAQTVLERVRKMDNLADIPILITLYREEDQGSPVSGSYVAKTGVKGSDMTIGEWETVNEENILFPSDEGKEKYYDHQQLVQNFGTRIEEFFPNYVGVIGEGFYKNEELKKLTLEIPLEFYGKGEVIGFTQYTYQLVKEMFSDYYDLEVKIKSNDKMESIIYREAGADEPTVHIFDK